MRCPKCSFISFDDLTTCAKCSKDLSVLTGELKGTCVETKVGFFLSSVVSLPEPEDETFSDSHGLPPIDDTDINLDDTLSADADQTLTGLDESLEISDDDISLELGDIMPIDLDQLDEPVDLEDDTVLDLPESVSMGDDSGADLDDDFDLDLTENFDDQDTDFDSTEILSVDTLDTNIDLNQTGDFDESIDLDLSGDFADFDLDETSIALEPISEPDSVSPSDTLSGADNLELDEDLLTTTTGEFPALDADATEVLELDDSLLGELTGDSEEGQISNELPAEIGEDLADFDLDETSIALEPISEQKEPNPNDTLSENDEFELDEDLQLTMTGEFPSLDTEKDEDLSLDDTPLDDSGEEQISNEVAADTDEDLADFDLNETSIALEPISEQKEPNQDDTLPQNDDFELDEDLQLTMTGELPSLDTEEDEDLEFADTLLDEPKDDSGEVQGDNELLANMDDELELDLGELEAGQQEEDLSLNSELQELEPESENEEMLGDELLASMDDELELDLGELEAGQQEEDLSLDSELQELEPEPQNDDQLVDEILASVDSKLDLEEQKSGQQEEDLSLGAELQELEVELTEDDIFESENSPSSGFDQIDLSDLISSPEEDSNPSPDEEEMDLTSLIESDEESLDSDLDMLDEDIPEFELIEEDDDEGPPDLP